MSNIRERTGEGTGSRPGSAFRSSGGVNPMDYISNLADAMLVLALGIMTALVLHWNVDLQAQQNENTTSGTAPTVELNAQDISDQELLPDAARSIGRVYYDDESGTYYITYDEDSPE